ncbi:MAG TPA: energy-coupling factor transporter ATPase [Candidatus Wallbacteria bacterium]|nr:energy-coupling factor transporter ATPase [Candidatus Wallbacteria bacterium]
MIEFKNVNFRYSNTEGSPYVLSGVDLKISSGEFIGVLGANGSGKSTLAKLLNCLLIPSSGSVSVCGFDTSKEENVIAVRRRVGFVFQNPENQIVGTIVENDVAFAPENLGIAENEICERVDYALDAVELTERRNFMTANLSGGQKQRLAIAGVLAMKPDILVLDEPTAMLDARGRERVMELILKINRELKITVVLVTHFMENSLLCDRIICLNHGLAEYVGKPSGFFRQGPDFVSRFNLRMPFGYELLTKLAASGIKISDEAWESAGNLRELALKLPDPIRFEKGGFHQA